MDNKEIEEIKHILVSACKRCRTFGEDYMQDRYAEALIRAGIGDKKQAVKEAFERLKVAICGGIYEDEDVYIENKWYTQKEFVGEIIDELFTELYGA